MDAERLLRRREYQRKRNARLATRFSERGRESLRVVAIWPRKKSARTE